MAVAAAFIYPRLFHKTQETNTLRLSGNIEAHESVVGFKVQGRIIELPVQEGQWVDAGTLLARLDGDDYRRQAEMDEAALRVQRAQLDLGLAGTRRQELEATQQSLPDAKADLAQKKLDYDRAETLFRERVGSQQERDQADTNLKRAERPIAAPSRYMTRRAKAHGASSWRWTAPPSCRQKKSCAHRS